MFGWIEFKIGKIHTTAMLMNSRRWRITPPPDKTWRKRNASFLNEIAKAPHYPHEGPYGPKQLKAAAELFGGTAFMAPICAPPRAKTY